MVRGIRDGLDTHAGLKLDGEYRGDDLFIRPRLVPALLYAETKEPPMCIYGQHVAGFEHTQPVDRRAVQP